MRMLGDAKTMPTNSEFLTALFGQNAPWVHVTDFSFDPNDIPEDQHLRAWSGGYFSRRPMGELTNQYFTISNFYADENGKARRRKALFWQTPVIVLDDVKEKLNMEEVSKLPRPTWILETSPGSEQWGYLLTTPCNDRAKVENLLDGLVANGLAPEGRDPGMKGVTRYVRLPDGINNKANKLVNGQPFKCRLSLWEPFNTVTMEQLAEPFAVDLDALRRDQRVDGAAEVSDHPLVNIPDIIHIKETRSAGRFDICCPWVDEHTGGVDNGTGIFTNDDGSIGFKCHHGACQERNGGDLLRYIEREVPGFGNTLRAWQSTRAFAAVLGVTAAATPMQVPTPPVVAAAPVDFMTTPSVVAPTAPPVIGAAERAPELAVVALDNLRREIPGSIEQRDMASAFLKAVDQMREIDRVHYHQQLRDVMRWNQKEFTVVINALRAEWYEQEHNDDNFFDDLVYVGELDEFFDRRKRIFYKPAAMQNNFAHLDSEARRLALEGKVVKVDKIDYSPRREPVFSRSGITYANSWQDFDEPQGVPGEVSRWLQHWDTVGWGAYRKHMLQWMAWTILYPETKINHMLLLGGAEGVGKDFLLYPLAKAMEGHYANVPGDALTGRFGEFLLSTKYVHINEVTLADHREAALVAERIKPLTAAPPETLYVDRKGVKPLYITNIVNCTMGTNSTLPFRTQGLSRRIYGVWSDLQVRDLNGETLPEWRTYWVDRWNWMQAGGAEACVHYLRNCVDLSDFNPGVAPPMTQFVRDINESSKPLLQQTIEAMMRTHFGCFRSDIVDANDVAKSVKTVEQFAPDISYVETRHVTPVRVMSTMASITSLKKRDIHTPRGVKKYWITCDYDRYITLTDENFVIEYERQIRQSNGAVGLSSITGGVR